jgi:hypothetical protein
MDQFDFNQLTKEQIQFFIDSQKEELEKLEQLQQIDSTEVNKRNETISSMDLEENLDLSKVQFQDASDKFQQIFNNTNTNDINLDMNNFEQVYNQVHSNANSNANSINQNERDSSENISPVESTFSSNSKLKTPIPIIYNPDNNDNPCNMTRKEFLKKFESFHKITGKKTRAPIVVARILDWFQFYCLVIEAGGYKKVTNAKIWKMLANRLETDRNGANSATILRKHYMNLLSDFEDQYAGLSLL